MNGKHLFLTSAGLTDKMKEKFFDIIGKCPKDVKVLYIPTAGIETDGARESLAICFHELFLMGIQYENILVYNLELILSKDYQRTYSSYVTTPFMLTRLLTFEELNQFDAVFVSGGDVSVLCREMSRTGFDRILNNAIKNGLIYVGISAGSMYAAGNLTDGLHIMPSLLFATLTAWRLNIQAVQIVVSPLAHCIQNRNNTLSKWGKRIYRLGRLFWNHFTMNHAVVFQIVKLLRKHLRRGVWNQPL